MSETLSSNENMEENDFIDLTDSLNSATLEELKERGAVGDFVLQLLERGGVENKKVMVKGVNTLTMTVQYGDEAVDFILKPSVDQGDEPIEHAHYEIWAADYKKPWVRSLIASDSAEWLRILPLNFADLTLELTGEDLKLNTLEQQFPNLTYGEMMTVIDEETSSLDEFFTYKQGVSAGAWGFYMMFKSDDMYEKYLQNDPVLMERLKIAASEFVPQIMARLRDLSTKKAA